MSPPEKQLHNGSFPAITRKVRTPAFCDSSRSLLHIHGGLVHRLMAKHVAKQVPQDPQAHLQLYLEQQNSPCKWIWGKPARTRTQLKSRLRRLYASVNVILCASFSIAAEGAEALRFPFGFNGPCPACLNQAFVMTWHPDLRNLADVAPENESVFVYPF